MALPVSCGATTAKSNDVVASWSEQLFESQNPRCRRSQYLRRATLARPPPSCFVPVHAVCHHLLHPFCLEAVDHVAYQRVDTSARTTSPIRVEVVTDGKRAHDAAGGTTTDIVEAFGTHGTIGRAHDKCRLGHCHC